MATAPGPVTRWLARARKAVCSVAAPDARAAAHNGYPYLAQFLGGYFHQDCMIHGETEASIIAEYIRTTHPYQRLGLRADVERFLHQHAENTLSQFEAAFAPDVALADDDVGLTAWLRALIQRLM